MRRSTSLAPSFAGILFVLAWAGTCLAQDPPPPFGRAEPIYIAVLDPLALENACDCVEGYAQRNYHALAAYLSFELHCQTNVEFGGSIDTVRRRIGRYPDIIIGKTSVVRWQARELKLPLLRIAALTDRTGSVFFYGLFVVRAEDKARKISDLKGRTILFGPEETEEKHRAALEALRKAGVAVKKPLEVRATCSVAAQDVVRGRADSAVISSYALPLLEGCKTIKKGSLRVIGRTRGLPFIGVFVTSRAWNLSIDRLKKAFFSVKRNRELLKKLESKEGFVDIVRVSKELKEESKTSRVKASKADSTPPGASQPRVTEMRAERRKDAGWIDWRGGRRRDAYSPYVPAALPEEQQVVWRRRTEGQSLGGIAATESLVIFSDKSADGKKDLWLGLRASDGTEVWRLEYPAEAEMDYTSAPRATPVIAGRRVYLLGALGDLHCVELKSGEVIWKFNILKRWGGKLPTWGFCGTPLLVDGRLIIQTTAPGANLVAIDAGTAEEIWRTATAGIAYGNLIVAVFGGLRQIVGYDKTSAGGWDLRTGKRLWKLTPPEDGDFNVPTPVVIGDKLLLATENNGTRLYAFDSAGRIVPEPIAVFEELTPNTTSPTLAEGTVWASCYEGLFCLDAARGLRCIWKSDREMFCDHSSIIAGNGHVLVGLKSGKLALLPARPEKTAQPKILTVFEPAEDLEPEMWSHPAIVKDRIYLRSHSEIVALRTAAGPSLSGSQ